jgi:hypothetical protein
LLQNIRLHKIPLAFTGLLNVFNGALSITKEYMYIAECSSRVHTLRRVRRGRQAECDTIMTSE